MTKRSRGRYTASRLMASPPTVSAITSALCRNRITGKATYGQPQPYYAPQGYPPQPPPVYPAVVTPFTAC